MEIGRVEGGEGKESGGRGTVGEVRGGEQSRCDGEVSKLGVGREEMARRERWGKRGGE